MNYRVASIFSPVHQPVDQAKAGKDRLHLNLSSPVTAVLYRLTVVCNCTVDTVAYPTSAPNIRSALIFKTNMVCLNCLIRCLAPEVRPRSTRFFSELGLVTPGYIKTKLNDQKPFIPETVGPRQRS